jgi:hypothetical protein
MYSNNNFEARKQVSYVIAALHPVNVDPGYVKQNILVGQTCWRGNATCRQMCILILAGPD